MTRDPLEEPADLAPVDDVDAPCSACGGDHEGSCAEGWGFPSAEAAPGGSLDGRCADGTGHFSGRLPSSAGTQGTLSPCPSASGHSRDGRLFDDDKEPF